MMRGGRGQGRGGFDRTGYNRTFNPRPGYNERPPSDPIKWEQQFVDDEEMEAALTVIKEHKMRSVKIFIDKNARHISVEDFRPVNAPQLKKEVDELMAKLEREREVRQIREDAEADKQQREAEMKLREAEMKQRDAQMKTFMGQFQSFMGSFANASGGAPSSPPPAAPDLDTLVNKRVNEILSQKIAQREAMKSKAKVDTMYREMEKALDENGAEAHKILGGGDAPQPAAAAPVAAAPAAAAPDIDALANKKIEEMMRQPEDHEIMWGDGSATWDQPSTSAAHNSRDPLGLLAPQIDAGKKPSFSEVLQKRKADTAAPGTPPKAPRKDA